MSTIYNYSVSSPPYLPKFNAEVVKDITGKILEKSSWLTGILTVQFNTALTAGEKTTLDGIVAESFPVPEEKTRTQIMTEILGSVSSQEQLLRVLDGLDKRCSFVVALDACNYSLARARAQASFAAGDITQDDLTLILSIVPEP